MIGELSATYGVQACVATLQARNHRSLALLRSLEFQPYVPGRFGVLERADDEIIMYKKL